MASIFIRTIIVYFLLSISMKVMGKREIGELEVSELITSLLISEICSIPIDNPDIPLLNAIIPVVFIVCAEIIVSSIKNRSAKLKRIVDGTASFIIDNGKLDEDALVENRISIEELFTGIRQNGISRIEDVKYCIIEPNGKLSVISKADGNMSHILISDGELMQNTITKLGYSEKQIKKALSGTDPKDIFLMTADDNGALYILRKKKQI